MPEDQEKQIKRYHFRAKLPTYLRAVAGGLLVIGVVIIAIGFYRGRSNPEFRMKGFPTTLSKDVIAEVNGYERRETDGDVVKYYIKADLAITFADNHQELQNAYFQIFDASGDTSDQITASKAVYIPAENKNFTAYLAGNVNIGTRDGLKIKTEQVTYTKADETAVADEQIEFERGNVHGRGFSALVNIPAKRLELHRDVFIETLGGEAGASSSIKYASIAAGSAVYDQLAEKIELNDAVKILANSTDGNADIASGRAIVFLVADNSGGHDARKFELFDNVVIKAAKQGKPPANITAAYALYEKDADKFTLKDNVNIATVEGEKPVTASAAAAVFEHRAGKIFLDGNAQVTQDGDLVKGDHIDAELFPSNSLKFAVARGNSFLRQASPERTTEVNADELNATFDNEQHISSANAVSHVTAAVVPSNAAEFSRATFEIPQAVHINFRGGGSLEKMIADGRSTIQLYAPDSAPDAANKRVTADAISAFFNSEGSALSRTEAVGNAELFVEPKQALPTNYKTTVNAPRFDCEFYPTGNDAKSCTAKVKTKTVRVPTVPSADRGTQTLMADSLFTAFSQQSRDIEKLEAQGAAKFTELDRNAVADNLVFTSADGYLRLRGGDPTVWDSSARARADEIDWDTKNDRSGLRGKVRTTYYSQDKTGGATPFGATDKPVYLTAATAEFDHRAQTGLYVGDARGWQENNYLRGDRILIRQREGEMVAEGNVKSLLYNATRRENGRESTVPVFASAAKMTYNRDARNIHYETDVDIRQGTDRIVGGAANVYLDDKNEVARTEIQTNVVITQPKRRASGDYAQYTAADDSVMLRGNPARVDDSEQGSAQAAQLTMNLKDHSVVGEGSKQIPGGRSRSVYKVREN